MRYVVGLMLMLEAVAAQAAINPTQYRAPESLMRYYHVMEKALTRDQLAPAKEAARNLSADASNWLKTTDPKVRYHDRVRRFMEASTKFADAQNIGEARERFAAVSNQAERFVGMQVPEQNAWNLFQCPKMPNRIWLSPSNDVNTVNPYASNEKERSCAELRPWREYRQ